MIDTHTLHNALRKPQKGVHVPKKPRSKKYPVVEPNILILEGCFGDIGDILEPMGADSHEVACWDGKEAEFELLSGDYNGLILTGGSDVQPALYGETPAPEVYGIDNLRDTVELSVLEIAEELGIPVLGICRGSQIMTVYRGGRLCQHIGEDHRGTSHQVYALPDARTFRRAINSRDMECISLHHQCVVEAGRGMQVAAVAIDGTSEAVESLDGKWLGVQFHPEINAFENSSSFAIFQWLVAKAAEHAGGRAKRVRFRDHKSTYNWARAYAPEPKRVIDSEDDVFDGIATEIARHASPPKKPRAAGEPSVPSMREMVQLVENNEAHRARRLTPAKFCPDCGMEFDSTFDCIDHCDVVHNRDIRSSAEIEAPFANAAERYPELEPPAGHEAWDLDDVILDNWEAHNPPRTTAEANARYKL